jgi:transposase
MQAMLYCCCGLDVHKDMVEACILHGETELPRIIRQQFSTTRQGLGELVVWLEEHECYHIAMESTGVYWRPVYEVIEEKSEYIENLLVVNARHMRNLPGRKSDVKDAEWIATLLRHGLLEKSFVAPRPIRDLREYSRLYRTFVQEKCRYVNRLEKFLQTHGFKLSSVMSDILCCSGRKILNILATDGTLTEQDVAENCRQLRRSREEISAAVCGSLTCAEQQLLKLLLHKIDTANADIEQILTSMRQMTAQFEEQLAIIDSIPGIDEVSAMEIVAEISTQPQEYFETAERLCSWAGLSPRNDESAGKVKSRKTLHGNPYIKSILCQVSWASVRSRHSYFHDWFWCRQGRLGRKKAITAVSRKILKLIYLLLSRRTFYDPKMIAA